MFLNQFYKFYNPGGRGAEVTVYTDDDMLIGFSYYEVNSQVEQFIDDSNHNGEFFPELLETE